MIDSFYIAWRYVLYHRIKTLTLAAVIVVITLLPSVLQKLVDEGEKQLSVRADRTPLLIGAKGSALDLVMNNLYFSTHRPKPIAYREAQKIDASGLAEAIPVIARHRARGFPVIGTTLEYFRFRRLTLRDGRRFGLLGEAVIGAGIARALKLQAGDRLMTTPTDIFNIAGNYPLRLRIVGVLASSHSPDDQAVFVDIRTAWIIDGIGHGHADLAKIRDPSIVLKREAGKVVASAKLRIYAEITAKNVASFHFHGDWGRFPLTAVLAVPADRRSEALLRGRYTASKATVQAVKPSMVIGGLLRNVFRIKNLLDVATLLVSLATLLALVLVFALSLRLRVREMETIFRLGCSRATTVRLMAAEIVIILVLAVGVPQYVEELTTGRVRPENGPGGSFARHRRQLDLSRMGSLVQSQPRPPFKSKG